MIQGLADEALAICVLPNHPTPASGLWSLVELVPWGTNLRHAKEL